VAIARVLVLEPRVLLLDEPFNALDAKLRGAMQVDLRQLIKQLGITMIFVTQYQEEALTMSDHTAVRRDGRIERMAPREKVCDRTATALWHRLNRLVEPRCAFCSAIRWRISI